MKYESIKRYADELVEILRSYCIRIEIAGSIRRQVPECKDIDIVCIPDKYKLEQFLKFEARDKIFIKMNGPFYKRLTYCSQMVDLYIAKPDNWGWIFLIRTGSAKFNVKLLTYYKNLYKFPEGQAASTSGYLLDVDGKPIATPEEKDVFNLLKVEFIEPTKRER